MPYQIGWELEKRIARLTVWGELTMEEIQDFTHRFSDGYLEVGHAPIHLIADCSGLQSHPPGIPQLREAATPFLEHPHMGWFVIASSTPLVGYLASFVTHVTHTYLNVDDALNSLKRADNTLI